MDNSTKRTVFADYDGGMDAPWYKVNDVCLLLLIGCDGWAMIRSERC